MPVARFLFFQFLLLCSYLQAPAGQGGPIQAVGILMCWIFAENYLKGEQKQEEKKGLEEEDGD